MEHFYIIRQLQFSCPFFQPIWLNLTYSAKTLTCYYMLPLQTESDNITYLLKSEIA